jgi:hypothetical protein
MRYQRELSRERQLVIKMTVIVRLLNMGSSICREDEAILYREQHHRTSSNSPYLTTPYRT